MIQESRFITKQYFPDGGCRANRDLLTCPLFNSNGKVYNCGLVYFVLTKKDFKGNSVLGFTESFLKEFEEI